MKPNFVSLQSFASRLLSVSIAVWAINSAHATTPTPIGTKIYPKISNAKDFEIVGGSSVTATWPAPKESTYKLWVQIPVGSNASNATYLVYPKGNAIGSTACDSTNTTYPCYQITVDQTITSTGWAQLKINNRASTTWAFTKSGYVTTSASTISTTQQLGIAQVSYQNMLPTPTTFTIGQDYQGGKIFYLDSTKQHGLIAAPTDQSTGIQWWNGFWINTGATGTAIGTGKANTTAIVQAQGAGSYAAKLCDDLVLGGYSDWYLPSRDELNELYKNRDAVGGFATKGYWSSSEKRELGESYESAWGTDFINDSVQGYGAKNGAYHVRAVRAF